MLDTQQRETQHVVARDVANHRPCYSIRPWACVYTHPQAEHWANANLRRAGYDTYLPIVAVRTRDRVIRTLWHTVERPAFPRYLFIRFDHRQASWTPIRATPGVADLVRCGTEVAYASEAAVEALQAAEATAALPLQTAHWRPGDAVRPIAGPFAGMPAVVLQCGAEMTLISMLMLGELREIVMQADNLEAREG